MIEFHLPNDGEPKPQDQKLPEERERASTYNNGGSVINKFQESKGGTVCGCILHQKHHKTKDTYLKECRGNGLSKLKVQNLSVFQRWVGSGWHKLEKKGWFGLVPSHQREHKEVETHPRRCRDDGSIYTKRKQSLIHSTIGNGAGANWERDDRE